MSTGTCWADVWKQFLISQMPPIDRGSGRGRVCPGADAHALANTSPKGASDACYFPQPI